MWKQRSETKINQLATQLQSTLDKNLEDKLQMLRMWGITSRDLLTLMSQFHNHAQYLKVTNSVGPLDNPTWQQLAAEKNLPKFGSVLMQLHFGTVFHSPCQA